MNYTVSDLMIGAKALARSTFGKKDEYNEVIVLKTIELMKKDIELDLNNVIIRQTIQVPIGCGFGTSASSAGHRVCRWASNRCLSSASSIAPRPCLR